MTRLKLTPLKLTGAAVALLLSTSGLWAQEDPFADAVETRHGLMLQMASDLGKIGAMVKGEVAYDSAAAAKAAANVAAVASVISLEQFPAGSEVGKSADSFAKAELWATPDDFLGKLADLNTAAATLVAGAGTDLDTAKAGLGMVGKACAACHETYRQPEG
ncbi:cytochrome c [Rhodobacter sp. KR11]|uniref:c-type cytochrome n=1 Tax=Rhodobacter sp. KR11 TaxID=2974588 RepID=UPI002223A808|nr:cytochrome c [Rhodobacter sp. KR11]MCW1917815.1 cytochrome c [Rhodobacter sp. KR11]